MELIDVFFYTLLGAVFLNLIGAVPLLIQDLKREREAGRNPLPVANSIAQAVSLAGKLIALFAMYQLAAHLGFPITPLWLVLLSAITMVAMGALSYLLLMAHWTIVRHIERGRLRDKIEKEM